jgi:LacI family transcriptional regulator
MHGYRAAMEAAGEDVPHGYIRSGTAHYEEGMAGGAALLDLPERPTAVFAATDGVAAGMIEAARARIFGFQRISVSLGLTTRTSLGCSHRR